MVPFFNLIKTVFSLSKKNVYLKKLNDIMKRQDI